MSEIDRKCQIEGPPLLWVKWGCRRCGFTGGIARTTFMVPPGFPEENMRMLLTELKLRKLIPKHYEFSRCLATVDDFVIEATVPDGKVLVERI